MLPMYCVYAYLITGGVRPPIPPNPRMAADDSLIAFQSKLLITVKNGKIEGVIV